MMKKTATASVMGVALIGSWLLGITPLATAQQEPPTRQAPGKQNTVGDQDLKAFAKAYVEYHKIQKAYEPRLNDAKTPEEKNKLQQEGNSKVKAAVEKQGLTVESYNRIFTAVNGNEELRKKAMKLINEERKKS